MLRRISLNIVKQDESAIPFAIKDVHSSESPEFLDVNVRIVLLNQMQVQDVHYFRENIVAFRQDILIGIPELLLTFLT